MVDYPDSVVIVCFASITVMFRVIDKHLLNYGWLRKYSACKPALSTPDTFASSFFFMNICSTLPLYFLFVNTPPSKELSTIWTYKLMTIRISVLINVITLLNATFLAVISNQFLRMFPIFWCYNRLMIFRYIILFQLSVISYRSSFMLRCIILLQKSITFVFLILKHANNRTIDQFTSGNRRNSFFIQNPSNAMRTNTR